MQAHTCRGQVSFSMDIAWSDDFHSYRDHYYVNQMNCWRDLEPGSFLYLALENEDQGTITRQVGPGKLVPPDDPAKVVTLPRSRIHPAAAFDDIFPGRFYPQGLIMGLPGIFKGNTTPFRCLEKNSRTLVADLNHPLALFPLTISLKDITWHPADRAERGGSCIDWIALVLSGPGLQTGFSRWPDCFFIPQAFDRQDRNPDAVFYQPDRLVHHIDGQARQVLTGWYQ
ncbi:MAG: hypothetical protein ACNA7H_10280, partial [Desulfotignum sp.]